MVLVEGDCVVLVGGPCVACEVLSVLGASVDGVGVGLLVVGEVLIGVVVVTVGVGVVDLVVGVEVVVAVDGVEVKVVVVGVEVAVVVVGVEVAVVVVGVEVEVDVVVDELEKEWTQGHEEDVKGCAAKLLSQDKKTLGKINKTTLAELKSVAGGVLVPQQCARPCDQISDGEVAGRKPLGDETQQSDNKVVQRLQAVINIMGNMAATMKIQQQEQRAQPGARSLNDQSVIHPKTEDLESLALIILQHSSELVRVYTAETVCQQDRIHQDSKKSKEELDNLQKRISDTEKRLKDMFRHVTGQNYKESSNKDGKRKQENHPDPVEILQQTIYNLEKQLIDYTRRMGIQGIKAKAQQRQSERILEEQLRVIRDRMEELAATMRPKPKDVNISPLHIEDSMSLTEAIISQYQEVLKFYKQEKDRINDAEKRLKDMFRKVTKQEYERDANGDNGNEKPNKPMDLKELVGDIENRFEDYTRTSDVEQRLKDMFRNVTKEEYASDTKTDNRKEKQSKSVDLMQLVGDIENRFEDYTRKMADKKVVNEAIRMYEMCTGEKYRPFKKPTVDSIAQLLKQKLESLPQHGSQEKEQHDKLQKEKEDLQKRINDAMQRLKDMFRNVTKQENVAHEKRGARKEKVSNQMDLQHLIDDIENWLLADYTRLSQQLRQKEMQYDVLYTQRDELLERLSQLVSEKLTTKNPESGDFFDEHRPTKLGDMYAELYDNEWTDAYEVLNKTSDEKRTISLLLEVLTTSYTYCLQHSYNQEMLLEGLLMLPASTLSEIEGFRTKSGFQEMERKLKGRPKMGDIEQKMLMDLRKATKSVSVNNIEQTGVEFVQKGLTKNDPSDFFRTYVQKCLHLCWFMCQQSPRMFIEVDLTKYSGTKFDKSTFREYSKFGKKVDYVVWLPLYLHKGGSLVRKGVADGK